MNGVKLSEAFLTVDRQVQLVEDFVSGAPDEWTTAGTAAAQGERGGVLQLSTAATDNAEASVVLDSAIAAIAANKPFSFAARVQFAEAATNAANVFVGLSDEAAATALGDNGAGPPADYAGVGLHKLDGGLNWIAEFSNSTTQQTLELTAEGSLTGAAIVAGSANYQLIEIDVIPKTSTVCDVVFKVDGVTVAKFLGQVFTSIAAMAPLIVVKAGGGTAEVIKVDFIKFAQVR